MTESSSPPVSRSGPLITTIIPTFERPDLLRRAVMSVLAQDFRELEVRIYDNASADNTAEVAAELARSDARVVYRRRDQNIGGTANFNEALKDVRTPYFSLLSDDDLLLPGFYSAAIAALETAPSAAFWCGRTAILDAETDSISIVPEVSSDADGRTRSGWTAGFHQGGIDSMCRMINRHFPWNGVLWRRYVLGTVSGIDSYGSDDNFIVRAALSHDFIVSDRPSAVLMLHAQGWTGSMLATSSSSTGLSSYLEHVIGRPRELERTLAEDPSVPREALARATEALRDELRHDLLAHYFFRSLPAGNPAEMRYIVDFIRQNRLGSVGVSALLPVASKVESTPLAPLQRGVARQFVDIRDRRRRSRQALSPDVARVRAFINGSKVAGTPT